MNNEIGDILVTGGAGFIGSNLLRRLLEQKKPGSKIVCVDDFNDYYDPAIKYDNISDFRENPDFVLCETDITNYTLLEKVFARNKINSVVHLAARAGVRPSIVNPILYQKVNVGGTMNILELCREYNIDKFIFASSSSVYGNNRKIPFSETDNVDFPISPYAATKKAGELLCYAYHHLYKMHFHCLRFFTVYGPGQRPEMAIHKFTKLISERRPLPLYGNGDTSRDYTYIDDIIEAIISSINSVNGYEIINLGNSSPVRLDNLISLIEEKLSLKALIEVMNAQPGDVDITYADISKAARMLNYKPQTSLESGIEKFVNWFNERNF